MFPWFCAHMLDFILRRTYDGSSITYFLISPKLKLHYTIKPGFARQLAHVSSVYILFSKCFWFFIVYLSDIFKQLSQSIYISPFSKRQKKRKKNLTVKNTIYYRKRGKPLIPDRWYWNVDLKSPDNITLKDCLMIFPLWFSVHLLLYGRNLNTWCQD